MKMSVKASHGSRWSKQKLTNKKAGVFMTKKQKRRLITFSVVTFLIITVLIVGIIVIVKAVNKDPFEGKWISSDKKITYVFDGESSMTAVYDDCNIPVLNVPYTGEIKGNYYKDKNKKTVSLSVRYYSKTITKNYSYVFSDNAMCLKDLDDGQAYNFYKVMEAEG